MNILTSRSAALIHTAKVDTPRFEFDKGTSYDEYVKCVYTWDKTDLAGTSVSRAGLLLMEFSSNDIYGGLKERLLDAVTVPVLKSEKGVETLLLKLKEIVLKPTLPRMVEWLDKLFTARQHRQWSIDRWVAEIQFLVKEAKEFDIDLGQKLPAGIVMRGVTSIPREIMGALTKDIKQEESDLFEKVVGVLRSYSVTSTSNTSQVKLTSGSGRNFSASSDDFDVLKVKEEEKKRKFDDRKRGGGKSKTERLRDRERCKEERLCYHCKSAEHGIRDCEGYKRKMSEMKASYLASGKVWDNRDGTFTHPDGSIRNQPDPISHVRKVQVSRSVASAGFDDAGVYDEPPSVNYLVSARDEVPEVMVEEQQNFELKEQIENIYDPQQILDDVLLGSVAHEDIGMNEAQIDDMLSSSPGADYEILMVDGRDVFPVNYTQNIQTKAIMDTGCARSCAGVDWTEKYIQTLSADHQKKVVRSDSSRKFKFGDNKIYTAVCHVIAPVYFGKTPKYLG